MKMRLWTVALCTGLLASTSVGAACTGGTSVTPNKVNPNNITYCRSNVTMNWWSAFVWCQSQGLELAHLTTLCPGMDVATRTPTTYCINYITSSSVSGTGRTYWTSVSVGNNALTTKESTSHYAYFTSLQEVGKANKAYAICVPAANNNH